MADQRSSVQYIGHVQGVGFRFTCRTIAGRHLVTGYVRNRADGSVELVVEGAAGEIEALLADIRSHFAGHIRDVLRDKSPATGQFDSFEIRV